MAEGFIHSKATISSAYDNPAILGFLKDIYTALSESPRNNRTFYVETNGRSKTPMYGILSPKFALYYRKIYSIDERVDTPLYVNKERYSEYTVGFSSSQKSVSMGINLKYLTGMYAYIDADSVSSYALDFAKGFTQDVGLCVYGKNFTLGASYNNLYGILWWEAKQKTKLPTKFFFTLGVYPFKELLSINAEYEENQAFPNSFFKGGIVINIPYKVKKWAFSVSGGYISDRHQSLLTYGFTIKKSYFSLAVGFDNKGNTAVTIYTKGK